MSLKRGHYSLLQYVPDLARREAANVGVLLTCAGEGFKEVRTLETFGHLRWRFGDGFEEDHARDLTFTVAAWIERQPVGTSLESWEEFTGRLGNELKMTPMRAVRFSEPSVELERLFGELVKPPSSTRLQPTLRMFRIRAPATEEIRVILETIRQTWREACLDDGETIRVYKSHAHLEASRDRHALPDPSGFLLLQAHGDGLWSCATLDGADSDLLRIKDALSK